MITRLKLSTVTQGLPKYRSMLAGNDAFIPSSYESIASATGTGSSGVITFSSIPADYQHLQIRYIGRTTATNTTPRPLTIYLNGISTGTSYAYHQLYGDGTSAAAGGSASQATGIMDNCLAANGMSSNIIGVGIIDIHDYVSSTKNTTIRGFVGCDTNGGGRVQLNSILFNDVTTVTSITLQNANNWTTETQFALYGIKS